MRRTLEPGSFLGRYQIVGPLGQGGMGVVYRARDAELGRDVAVKLVTAGDAPTDTLATRLMREAQALAQLSHPNVVAVYDVGRVSDGVFLAMELVQGETGDAWIKRRPPWREVLQVFRDAGRGLAAAHKVGLVHRDFKPANLILGSDGRVRVLDFGLARAAQTGSAADAAELASLADDAATWDGERSLEEETRDVTGPSAEAPPPITQERPPITQDPLSSSSERRLLETPLTQVGAIVGTPPYMAPEQHLGGGCDARTDQFSFCVSFYQALYGERPFDGTNYAELSTNIIKGKVKPPPPGATVPAWLRAVVLRGLSVAPEKRFASMDEILEAMARDPAQRRRRLGGIAGVAALVAVAGAASWRSLRGPIPCRDVARKLDGVWDAARKQAVSAAFTRSTRPYAADALAGVVRALDAYTQGWVAMQTDACEATHVRGTQSAELLDLRSACLSRRLDDVRAGVELLAAADDELVAHANEVTRALPRLADCADAEALRATVRPPSDPATKTRVDAARKSLARAHAQWAGGRYDEAKKLLEPAVAEARAIGYRPLEGEALLLAGQVYDSAGDYPRARASYADAAVAAEAGRDDETAALAECGLVWVVGERMGKYPEALEQARVAQAKIDRLGRQELLQAQLDGHVAAIYSEQGKYKEAEERTRRVLATREKLLGPDSFEVADALGDLADVNVQLGHYKEAIELYRRALAGAEKAVGAAHPKVGNLHVNLGAALRSAGRNAEAVVEYRRAQEIIERSLGREHPMLATVDINYGSVLFAEGRDAEAATEFKRALEIWTKNLGPDHPSTATAWFRLGSVALKQGRAEEARVDFGKALDIWQAKLGPDHPTLSAALDGLGDALLAEGKLPAAMASYKRALALLERSVGPKHPALADPLVGIGLVQLSQHAPAGAVAPLERALWLRDQDKEADPLDVARTQFALARALAASSGDEARATRLATDARAAYAAHAAGNARELAEIDRWLHRR